MGTARQIEQQAKMRRAGQLSSVDTQNLTEEVEDLGRSEKRALASHMTVLLAHLLKWQHQPELRSKSWQRPIATQRKEVHYELAASPSLKPLFCDPEWIDFVWSRATVLAGEETGIDIDTFPEACPWGVTDVLWDGWLPAE